MPISYTSAVILLHVSVWLNALALLSCLRTLAKMEKKCSALKKKKKKHAKGFLCSALSHWAACLRWSNYIYMYLVSVRGRWCLIKHQAYPLLIVSQTWKLKRQSMIIALNIKLSAFNFSCYIVCVFTRNVVQDVELPNGAIFTSVNTVTQKKACSMKMELWCLSSRTSQLPRKTLKTILKMGVLSAIPLFKRL